MERVSANANVSTIVRSIYFVWKWSGRKAVAINDKAVKATCGGVKAM